MDVIRYAWNANALGDYLAAGSHAGLVDLAFAGHRGAAEDMLRIRFPDARLSHDPAWFRRIFDDLDHLVEEPAVAIEIPLDLRGSQSERRIWSAIRTIPCGSTLTHTALAHRCGMSDAAAVVRAVRDNPLPIVIPSHRVLADDGAIIDHRWGLCRQRAMLRRERPGKSLLAALDSPPIRRALLAAE